MVQDKNQSINWTILKITKVSYNQILSSIGATFVALTFSVLIFSSKLQVQKFPRKHPYFLKAAVTWLAWLEAWMKAY
jgi:hypothetical protein